RASEKYQLNVVVNNQDVAQLNFDAASPTAVLEVPAAVLARGEKIAGTEQRRHRIHFELKGRAQFTFTGVLSGFVAADQVKATTERWRVQRRYQPAPLEMDGRPIPRGFDVLSGSYKPWRNKVTQLPVGRRAEVRLQVTRPGDAETSPEALDYLVLTEPLPSGVQVVEGSVRGGFDRFETGPGFITFYIGDRRHPGEIAFDVHGYLPGDYRTAPTVVRGFENPSQMAIAPPASLTVLPSGERSKDEYRLTPRELFETGKRLLAKKDFVRAGLRLGELFDGFRLKSEIYRETAEMLLDVSLQQQRPEAVVRYFEVIKEKYPALELDFDKILQIGAAYRDLNEYERAYLVFRATAEASFMTESQSAGFLNEQGEFLKSVDLMDRITREYPAEPYIAAATYTIIQGLAAKTPDAELSQGGLTRAGLIRESIRRLDSFLTVWPDDPNADEASFSLASFLVELELWAPALARCERFAARYPDSEFLD
ncbi:MAG: hypothetical protein N2C14_11395, partial [Planctomycetales bacterium]